MAVISIVFVKVSPLVGNLIFNVVIPLSQLNLTFIEDLDFYLHIERKLSLSSVSVITTHLLTVAKIAVHRNYISHCGCKEHYWKSDKENYECKSCG